MPTSIASSDADGAGDLAEAVRCAAARRAGLRIVGGGTKDFLGHLCADEILSVAGHRGVIAYEPSELVVTARAGTPIVVIERILAERGQMLGFEPPILGSASTLGGVVASGLSGPRRPFAGAVRDFVLGVTVLDGQGRPLRFGGTVVKNVAGFDAFRLMAGAMGSLGLLLDISLRVVPRPRAERAMSMELDRALAVQKLTALMRRPTPLSGAFHDGRRLHLRLSGAAAAVARAAREIGGEDEDLAVWDDLRHLRRPLFGKARLWRLSVPRLAPELPLEGEWLHDWAGAQRWLASDVRAESVRAAVGAVGGHATLFRGAAPDEAVFTPLSAPLLTLHQGLKRAFDPAGVFNPGRMYKDF